MEAQLQSLIDIIKKEAIDDAERQASAIRKGAEAESARIVREARQEAERIVTRAREEANRTLDAGKKALEQAARNLILGTRGSIIELFDRILRQEAKESLGPTVIVQMLSRIAENWDHRQRQELEVLVNKSEIQDIETYCQQRLRESLRSGITLRPVETVEAGFYVGERDRSTFYDFTDSGIAQILSQYLNPRLASLLSGMQAGPDAKK